MISQISSSSEIQSYFNLIEEQITHAYSIAGSARALNLDPEPTVSIILARNMAERVVGLISVVSPQISNTSITSRISELEQQYGLLDWRVGFKIAEEVAQQKFCSFKDSHEAIEVGIRLGFAYLTLGIVSAPLEGFIGLKIKKRRDGKQYFALQYAGPIRGAGGTAASTSVILGDYIRVKMGYYPYDPDPQEISRYITEVQDYHERVTNLQYLPSEEELRFIISHLPVEVDGDPTERFEVSNYKDLPRIETNFIRGGVPLVLAEGLCQKAPKLWLRLSDWGKKFDIDWTFLGDFIKLKERIHSTHSLTRQDPTSTSLPLSQSPSSSSPPFPGSALAKAIPSSSPQLAPNFPQSPPSSLLSSQPSPPSSPKPPLVQANNTFIMDLVAGRPILTHPLATGGFRLRYGRTRTSGFSAAALHPATLIVLDRYIAIGTQLKVERPGKAATVTLCDALEGPIVRLLDGTVLQLNNEDEAKKINKNVDQIIFLGDILFNYGDFSESGQKLVPAGYCPEWWSLELGRSLNISHSNLPSFPEPPYNFSSKSSPQSTPLITNNTPSAKITSTPSAQTSLTKTPSTKTQLAKSLLTTTPSNNSPSDDAYSQGSSPSTPPDPISSLKKSLQNSDTPTNSSFIESHLASLPNLQEISNLAGLDSRELILFLSTPHHHHPTLAQSLHLTKTLNIPLHPRYTLFWKLLSPQSLYNLRNYLREGKLKRGPHGLTKIILPYTTKNHQHIIAKKTLEELGCPHTIISQDNLVISEHETNILSESFNFHTQAELENSPPLAIDETLHPHGLAYISHLSGLIIKDRAGTFIGARMGRPEKAKMRHLTGSPQVMFPVGEQGDRLRSFQSALQHGKVISHFPVFLCSPCAKSTIYASCEVCKSPTTKKYHCRTCGDIDNESCHHGPANGYKVQELDIRHYYQHALAMLGERISPELVKGIRGTSNKHHIVEHLSKGLLRSKHNIYVNKDGTTRYDCTELPITHFRPQEIHAPLDKLISLGYCYDIHGKPLTDDHQLLELKPQDIIIPGFDSLKESGPQALTNIANFIDELLVKFYHLPPFYNIRRNEDLIGHLVIGLAPHTSAGLIGRIIGVSQTQGLLAHPLYHAGLRRDCDGDEAGIMLLMDALLNFSRQYLPERRGAKTMDSPLVLTSILNPAEVDDQVHGVDVMWRYPLEFYEAAEQMRSPKEVRWGDSQKKIEQLKDRLGSPLQFEKIGFTHEVYNFNRGVQCSAYKTAPSMQEKLEGQMEIARKVRAVNMDDVAKLVIQKHFLKDIKGNLRKFSMQQFRCVKCNEKYRRPPLLGSCTKCGGKLIFTISEGSVTKYLEPSLNLCAKYDFSPYLKQTLSILKTDAENIFGKEKDKQVGLNTFI